MFDTLGLGGAAAVMVAIVGGAALLPVIAVQFVATRTPTLQESQEEHEG